MEKPEPTPANFNILWEAYHKLVGELQYLNDSIARVNVDNVQLQNMNSHLVEHNSELGLQAIKLQTELDNLKVRMKISPKPTPPPSSGHNLEEVELAGGQRIFAHKKEDCMGPPCPIHHPSEHHMKGWPQHWRDDRKLMERICAHGVGHPDPDGVYKLSDNLHGCDGCCTPPGEASDGG